MSSPQQKATLDKCSMTIIYTTLTEFALTNTFEDHSYDQS